LKSKDLFPAVFSRHAAAYQRRLEDIMARDEARGRLRAIELVDAQPGMRVLDLACGPGTLSRRLAPIAQQVPGVTSAATMALLRQAIRDGQRVLLGVVDPDGTTSRHTILPISLAGGFVRGHESATQRLQSFPLHRLTAVSVVDDAFDDEDDPA